jgi:hypothetical protein
VKPLGFRSYRLAFLRERWDFLAVLLLPYNKVLESKFARLANGHKIMQPARVGMHHHYEAGGYEGA